MSRSLGVVLAVAAASALALAGCSSTAPAAAGDSGIRIVASTDVYADIAASIGGDLVSTQAIISGTAVDPHSYEASARDQLAVADADVIIMNGGGYDPFMDDLIAASGTEATVIVAVDAVDAAAPQPDADKTAEPNEHVWYDLRGMADLAAVIESALVAPDQGLDQQDTAAIEANTAEFVAGIETLEARADEIQSSIGEVKALVSEPVALALLERVGIENVTPEAFSSAVESGSDVSVALLDEVLSLATSGEIGLLAYNEQTVGPDTERLLKVAKGADVPVVSFSETLPEGQDYRSWMSANLEAIAAAVS